MKAAVIKVGGAFMDHPEQAIALLKTLDQLQSKMPVVLVHGGGSAVQDLLTRLGFSSEKIDGLRVTPQDQIGIVTGVLAGSANKSLCALAIKAGLSPVGLSLGDGNMVQCRQLRPELGCVGEATPDKPGLLQSLLASGFLPIISSIGCDDQGQLLNVNADQAAMAIASLLNAELLLLSDVAGVLDETKSLIPALSPEQTDELIQQGVIRDGMVVKVRAAQDTANQLGRPVTIASWQQPELLLAYPSEQVGTRIFPSEAMEKKS